MLRVAIVGYGNLGKGVEKALLSRDDAKIVGVFSRRDPQSVNTLSSPVYSYDAIFDMKDEIDVCILCGGSFKDLPTQTPELAQYFNVVDSFDTHKNIENHQKNINKMIVDTTAIVSVGWDPGLFSIQRLYFNAILGETSHTFWGPGVSQGHSDALRKIEGVIDAVQITVPNESAIHKALEGEQALTNMHKRVCYVVTDRKDLDALTHEIQNLPNYFQGYETEVNYLSQTEMIERFPGMPHGGRVIASDGSSKMEFKLTLDSNPEFTAKVLVAYAYACYRMNKENMVGCYTVYDVAPRYLLENTYNIL